jgi:hemolysin activation/secretion protein
MSTPGGTFIGITRPYGVGDFNQAGVRARATLGRRDLDRPASGLLWAGGTYYPKMWDVEEDFGNLEAQAVAFLAPKTMLGPQLGLRVGAKKVFGRFPFHESAFVGGPDQVRGLRAQRYAGDAALFGSAELHLRLAEVHVLLPSHLGVLGVADIGRVYLDGETSDEWHSGVGAGIWLAPLKRSTSLAVLMAWSEGEKKLYIQGGFGF